MGSELWTAKWPGQWSIKLGQKIPVQILPENLLFFDEETGELIKSAEIGKRTRGCSDMSMTNHSFKQMKLFI